MVREGSAQPASPITLAGTPATVTLWGTGLMTTDPEPGGMVDKDAAADFCRRVDVGLEHRRGTTLQIERKVLAVLSPQPVGQAMGLDRVKALEIQHGLDKSRGRRIAIVSRHDIGPEGVDDLG